MKKLKKYIYPPIFSFGFIAFWGALVIIINATSRGEGYGGLGLGMLILFAWLIVVLPIYCIRYSKIIVHEKLRFLFAFYNAVVLSFLYLLPFSLGDGLYIYCFILFVWVALWTVIPLIVRLMPRDQE